MLPAPRAGSTWARPNNAPCSAIAGDRAHAAEEPAQDRAPRKTISSTIGAATTAVIEQRDARRSGRGRSSPMPSVLLDERDVQHRGRAATTTISTTIAAIQMTGPQPRSDHRKRRPRSSRRSPRAPPAGGVPAPPDRRPVADDDVDRGVHDDRPVELHDVLEQHPADDQATRRARRRRRRRPARAARRWAGAGTGRRRPCAESTRDRRSSARNGRAVRVAVPAGRPRRSVAVPRIGAAVRAVRTSPARPDRRPRRQRTGGRRLPRSGGATMGPIAGSLWAATMPGRRRWSGRRPLDGDLDVDVAIVGAGFTGLWTAPVARRARPVAADRRHRARRTSGSAPAAATAGWCSALLATGPAASSPRQHGRDGGRSPRSGRCTTTVDEVGRFAGDVVRRRRLPQGRHRHVRPHAGPARPAGGRGRRGAGLRLRRRTTCAG